MQYRLVTPWENQTWQPPESTYAYLRLAGRRLAGGTTTGSIPVSITDVPRGVSLLVTGSVVTATLVPYQDDLSAADYYFLGGHEYVISQEQADVLTNAGYGSYLTPIVEA